MSIPEKTHGIFTEEYYSPEQIAKSWGLDVKTVLSLFADEEGVEMSEQPTKGRMSRRRQVAVQIPRRVLERVHARLSVPGEPAPDTEPTAAADSGPAHIFPERYYSLLEIAEMWGMSVGRVRSLFKDEEGVASFDETPRGHIHHQRTVRVPQHVVDRVHARIHSANGWAPGAGSV